MCSPEIPSHKCAHISFTAQSRKMQRLPWNELLQVSVESEFAQYPGWCWDLCYSSQLTANVDVSSASALKVPTLLQYGRAVSFGWLLVFDLALEVLTHHFFGYQVIMRRERILQSRQLQQRDSLV